MVQTYAGHHSRSVCPVGCGVAVVATIRTRSLQSKATTGKVLDGRKTTNNLLVEVFGLVQSTSGCLLTQSGGRRHSDRMLFCHSEEKSTLGFEVPTASRNVYRVVFELYKVQKRFPRPCLTRRSAAECSKPLRDPDFAHFTNFSEKKHYFSEIGTMLGTCTLTTERMHWGFRV